MASQEIHVEIPELAQFDPMKKKKKKKTTTREFTDENANPLAENMENLTVSDGTETSFAGSEKKKTNLVDPKLLNDDAGEAGEEKEGGTGEEEQENATGKDYAYEELLGRVFSVLHGNNPEFARNRRRMTMRPPEVMREGTKKTVLANFTDLCRTIHRQPEHVMSFFIAELATSMSLDGQQRLVIKGRFAPKNFEGIIRKYMNEYVICSGCKTSDTILSKENRLHFLRCEQCGSGRSVPPITKGYVARVGRRAAA